MIQILIFLIISVYVFYKATGKFYEIYQNINLGKPQPTGGSSSERLRNMVLFALGQKNVFTSSLWDFPFIHLCGFSVHSVGVN